MIGGYCPDIMVAMNPNGVISRSCVSSIKRTGDAYRSLARLGSSVPPLSAIGQVCLKQLPRGNQRIPALFLVNPQVAPKTLLVE
jgi:hypothetical protein